MAPPPKPYSLEQRRKDVEKYQARVQRVELTTAQALARVDDCTTLAAQYMAMAQQQEAKAEVARSQANIQMLDLKKAKDELMEARKLLNQQTSRLPNDQRAHTTVTCAVCGSVDEDYCRNVTCPIGIDETKSINTEKLS